MRNLIVLGSGRSGTSATAGLFRNVPGIFYGYDLLEPSDANPSGYYEDAVINSINDIFIRKLTGLTFLDVIPKRILRRLEGRFPVQYRDARVSWLAQPKQHFNWLVRHDLGHLMTLLARHQPFLFKDPRFGFTLPLWRPYLTKDVQFLVIFRNPVATVRSIMRFALNSYGDHPLPITQQWATDHWLLIYKYILLHRARCSEDALWLFVEFSPSPTSEVVRAMETFCECSVDTTHLESSAEFNTSYGNDDSKIQAQCAEIYQQLCLQSALDVQRLRSSRTT